MQKTTDGRERREAEKELEMQEKKIKIGGENLMSLRTHLASNANCEIAIVVAARMSRVPGFSMKGFF